MAISRNGRANTAHVNMMTDTVIANLPADGLRVVMRSLLASCPEITSTFERETRKYVEQRAAASLRVEDTRVDVNGLKNAQNIVRCMLGSGLCFQSLSLISKIVIRGTDLVMSSQAVDSQELQTFLASVDGDIVQAMTAVQKALFVATGVRMMSSNEQALVQHLYQALTDCHDLVQNARREYPYVRGLVSTASALGTAQPTFLDSQQTSFQGEISKVSRPREARETFQLKDRMLPRIFSGLWQLSSPAWGSAPTSKIVHQFSKHVEHGFTAFDMADHYGDAEIIFGRFLSSYPHKDAIFAATKYCVFHPMNVSREVVRANVSERCQRLGQGRIDLLQFHWQFYEDPQYLDALRFLSEDERVGMIGLCNFDTEHLQRVLDHGIDIHANQVQFSLIDSRPMVEMGAVCEKHNVKLLTYGTLCGGFLADKWLGKPEPDLYDGSVTPSQRKYYEMIRSWGGWILFQELLKTLHAVSIRHGVGISNVATRWVLDFPYVGAVIVGARMGISEHTEENLSSFGWSLDQQDRDAIEGILTRSRRLEMFESMGDCGGEYRSPQE